MASQEEIVVLRVILDEGKTKAQLQALVLDIEKTRQAQAALNQQRRAGEVSDAAYAAQSVKLAGQLREQQNAQRGLTQNLDLYSKAVDGVGGSYAQTQAQLALAQKQFQQLAGSADNSTDETQALAKVIDELRGTLKTTDAGMGVFVRNVGNYAGAVEPLILDLKRLEVQQQGLAKDSPAYQQQQARIVGFQQAINKAGAEAGLSYEQTQAKLKNYGDQIKPVVENLVQLEREQVAVGDEGSEAYARIGFQLQGLKKQLAEVPTENKKVSDSLQEVDQATGAFGGQVSSLRGAFNQAKQGVEAARLGFVGLKGAIAATGIGLLILTLAALYTYFTRTQEGLDFVDRKFRAVGIVVGVLTDKVSAVGQALVAAFTNPKKALVDLADFVGNNLLNRLTAFGVLLEGIKSGSVRQLRDGMVQLATGVSDATAKTKAFTDQLGEAAAAGEQIAAVSQQIRDQERALGVERAQSREQIKALNLLAEDTSKTTAQRAAAARQAGEIELALNTKLLDLQRRKIANIEREQALTNNLNADNDALAEEQRRLAEISTESLELRTTINNKLNTILQAAAAKTKADREKAAAEALEAQRQALQTRIGTLELELSQVEKNSDQELNLLRQKLAAQHTLELAAKKLTVGEKRLLDATYEVAKLKLTADSERQRAKDALEAERAFVGAGLLLAAQGSQQRYNLAVRALELDTELQLAALEVREDNAAKEFALRAKLQADLAQLARDNAAQDLERQRQQLEERAKLLTLATDRQLLGLSQEEARRVALSEGFLNARKAALLAARDALVTATREGSAERLQIEQETAAKLLELDRQTTEGRQQLLGEQYGALASLAADSLSSLNSVQEAGKAQALGRDEAQYRQQLAAAGDNAEQREKLEKQHAQNKERIEREYAEKRRKIALAQAFIDLAAGVLQILRAPAAPFIEPFATIVRSVQIGLLTATAGAQIATINAQRFERGGVLQGASHQQGGVQLYHRGTGQHLGEAEGDEIILTKGVWRSPLLRPLASILNVLGGGRQLAPARHMALGGVASASLVRESVTGNAVALDYAALAQAYAVALQKAPLRVGVSDIRDGLNRAEFTDSLADS